MVQNTKQGAIIHVQQLYDLVSHSEASNSRRHSACASCAAAVHRRPVRDAFRLLGAGITQLTLVAAQCVCANPLPLLGVHGHENDGHRGPSDSGSDSTSLLKAPSMEKTLSLRSPALSVLPQLKPVSKHTTDVEANGSNLDMWKERRRMWWREGRECRSPTKIKNGIHP
ncbi:hypothetical protein B0H14DRAFT_2557068 [Mycena olivaceomarginata]|nr:hypothetical protein B0H14DRAFT_2557068 [Mycena olivaceomarginata]